MSKNLEMEMKVDIDFEKLKNDTKKINENIYNLKEVFDRPILRCFEKNCKNNLFWGGELSCNLKYIEIGKNGKCACFEEITEEYKKNKNELLEV